MDQKTFSILLEKYLGGNISQEEVNNLLDSLEDDSMRQQWETAIGGILADQAQPRRQKRPLMPYAAAAAILTLLVSGILYFTQRHEPAPKPLATQQAHTITPGGNKAILTLADGSQITLDSATNGAIAHQGNVQVIKLNNGQLAYKTDKNSSSESHYNSLITPRGGQFMIILPDGSKVWLNAATSLRYPTTFTGNTREVQLAGEAYFEIAQNAQQPFVVKVNNLEVKVLGTHFNIMGYPDEKSIQTTLLQGAVQVQHNTAAVRLSPGQQARLQDGNMTIKKDVDVEEIIAWKNGYFHFNHETLQGVMRQISRWYDVEVIYEGAVPEREFGGKIERNNSLNDVLKILELSNVHYKIKERKIIITS
ncbi:FecR family protein [Chitinophaga silvisoli]|uniref:FecR family protein n=1 Tax=Chitinophaga silvisoli TaxID=2291814 RepID=A0A3E1P9Y6_9BACT|nr:FecR family protein [Chitinophaga silvisoli]RFM36910.1 FecR family protein [Chitinophaga silvisoli]